jgi:hypothetical protein
VLDLGGNCLSAFPSDINGLTNLQVWKQSPLFVLHACYIY